jgi:drug/metabolite transporter (DMT)-like permease
LSALTTYLSSVTLIWLLKNYEATQIIPQIQPIVMLMTIFAGVFIFNEKITSTEMTGISLIISGVYIINNFKSISN